MKNRKSTNEQPLLEVKDLTVSFSRYDRGWNQFDLEVIHSLDVEVRAGEILAVVGSSGSGKSLLAHAILGILPGNARICGQMKFRGRSLTKALQNKLRGDEIAFIPQSVDFLDPLMKVGAQVKGGKGTDAQMKQAFRRYHLDEKTAKLYPFQLSGGMARRILIATAVMAEPKLIVADEPTPGLDEAMAVETLSHFREFANRGCGVLLITHDIDLALQAADRIAVFYAGTTVEVCVAGDFQKGKDALRHPYSRAFLDALPQNGFKPIGGSQPYAGELREGCLFASRCSHRKSACGRKVPMRDLRGGKVRCLYAT